MTDRPATQLIQAARLFQNVSKNGATYFSGRWGSLKVVIFENRQHNPADPQQNHTHNLMLGQADPYVPKPNGANPPLPFQPRPTPAPPSPPDESPPWDEPPRPAAKSYPARRPDDRGTKRVAGGGRTQLVDDVVPFGPSR